jgi:hypothetical protein
MRFFWDVSGDIFRFHHLFKSSINIVPLANENFLEVAQLLHPSRPLSNAYKVNFK